ncbi:MAG TPA: hypothetical protein VHX61_19065 [Rhizomicrobium sp.]|jgi:hypothetical protein|nr:hypothetical protein [Rhizomicrobium sp.]
MDWNALSPYFIPLLVAAFLVRRAMREQKPKRVRFTRLWLFPALLLLVTWTSLAREPAPGLLLIAAFLLAVAAGSAIGWYRVHTLEFSVDPESGKVSARATQLGALLIVGLIALRWGADLVLKKLGLNAGTNLMHATDAMLLLSTSMYVARSIHTWIRARALVAAHRTTSVTASTTNEHGQAPKA